VGIIAPYVICRVCLKLMKTLRFAGLVSGLCLITSGCSTRVTVPDSASNNATIGSSAASTHQTSEARPLVEPVDLDAEETISKGSVQAWRKGLAGDVDGAMKQLDELNKKYPKAITVRFMMGQVLERSGRKAEAVKYYRDAVRQSQFNLMYLFKLAESLRTTGDSKGAVQTYKDLLALDPNFVPAKIGLARALWKLDKNSPEARTQIEESLAVDPKNQDAKSFLAEMGSTKH